jgi:hypothetical protein
MPKRKSRSKKDYAKLDLKEKKFALSLNLSSSPTSDEDLEIELCARVS